MEEDLAQNLALLPEPIGGGGGDEDALCGDPEEGAGDGHRHHRPGGDQRREKEGSARIVEFDPGFPRGARALCLCRQPEHHRPRFVPPGPAGGIRMDKVQCRRKAGPGRRRPPRPGRFLAVPAAGA
ncbi:hypothetical protein GCM10011504_04870 [Siccirubricoccus deserti]|nr:hypothetical protein GCM10011504_04870 [Siccirubricoccus deserti]